jgi:hypothetical protein
MRVSPFGSDPLAGRRMRLDRLPEQQTTASTDKNAHTMAKNFTKNKQKDHTFASRAGYTRVEIASDTKFF